MSDSFRFRRLLWPGLALLGLAPLAWARAITSAGAEEVRAAEPAARYPYDPVCPWGRVADGQGMLVRCLEAGEAQRLALTRGPSSAPVVPSSIEAPALSRAAPLAMGGARARSVRRVVVKEVGQALADTGDLPEAQRQLRRPLERYVSCVENNGGLDGDSAAVTVRFLVRERGRAEGVAVKERRGVSLAAAKCVADVIDRRYVGYPAAPIVGATLTIDFRAEGSAH